MYPIYNTIINYTPCIKKYVSVNIHNNMYLYEIMNLSDNNDCRFIFRFGCKILDRNKKICEIIGEKKIDMINIIFDNNIGYCGKCNKCLKTNT
jgi:hypothetical protein